MYLGSVYVFVWSVLNTLPFHEVYGTPYLSGITLGQSEARCSSKDMPQGIAEHIS